MGEEKGKTSSIYPTVKKPEKKDRDDSLFPRGAKSKALLSFYKEGKSSVRKKE